MQVKQVCIELSFSATSTSDTEYLLKDLNTIFFAWVSSCGRMNADSFLVLNYLPSIAPSQGNVEGSGKKTQLSITMAEYIPDASLNVIPQISEHFCREVPLILNASYVII